MYLLKEIVDGVNNPISNLEQLKKSILREINK